jgi:hypothetical protein
VSTSQRGVAYLAQTAPKPPPPPGGVDLLALRRPWAPTGQELSAFARRVEAVKDPVSVLEAMAPGTVTREHVETLREVHPELHAELRGKVLERVASRARPPSPTSNAWRWASFSGSRWTPAPPRRPWPSTRPNSR